jgi:hypothetical protein
VGGQDQAVRKKYLKVKILRKKLIVNAGYLNIKKFLSTKPRDDPFWRRMSTE